MNILDRAINAISPEAGLRRIRARAMSQHLVRAYEGASNGRRTDGWITSSGSANAEIGPAIMRSRNRARDLARNNPYAGKALNVIVANAIGTGITAQARTGNEKQDKQINSLWQDFTESCDADGQLDFYGQQALMLSTAVEGGESLLRFRDRYETDPLPVPLQLQCLEGDFLDTSKSESLDSGYRLQGVEFNGKGDRIGYWLYQQHPGDVVLSNNYKYDSKWYDAKDILHFYKKQRMHQVRGITWFAPILIKTRDLDEYDEAELVRKKLEACHVAAVTRTLDAEGEPLGPSANDKDGNRVESFEPGMYNYFAPGEEVKFNDPTGSGGYGEYHSVQGRLIAAGMNMPYELLTGDLSQVNYSSIRCGFMEFRRYMDMIRWGLIIPGLCRPVWRRFIKAAYLARKIPALNYGVEWTGPAYGFIDRLKEAEADNMMIRNGTMSWSNAVAAQGEDPDTQLARIKEINAKWDAAGIVLDCDARRSVAAGKPVSTDAVQAVAS